MHKAVQDLEQLNPQIRYLISNTILRQRNLFPAGDTTFINYKEDYGNFENFLLVTKKKILWEMMGENAKLIIFEHSIEFSMF